MAPSPRYDTEDVDARPAKRSRVLVACERCKRRRQKCDNAAPACSNCARSSAICSYPTHHNHPNPSYVSQLEDRIGVLEARLQALDSEEAGNRMFCEMQDERQGQMATPSSIAPQQSPVATSSTGHLASGIGLLSSCAAAEPHYFGFSSGLTLAHFVEAGISGNDRDSQISLPSLADRPFSKRVPTAQTPLATLPAQSTGERFIEAYLSNIHPLYPFIDEAELWRLHRETTSGSRSSTAADLARMHLIYAIGSRCIQLVKPGKVDKHLPEGHLLSAMQHIPEVLKSTSLHAVEITLLLALHSMRSPSGASVWHLCGFAMRLCLELGLHRPRPSQVAGQRLEQQRRKLFWSVYIFERKSALVLGRPFAVSDKDIEIPPPEASTDSAISLDLHRHYIRLYQIHSKIRSTLHCLKYGASHEKVQRKVATCLGKLDEWKDSILERPQEATGNGVGRSRSTTTALDSSDSGDDATPAPVEHSHKRDETELLLEYFKARRSLLQPLLTESGQYTQNLSDFAACADAAGQICQHYRKLHRLSALPFTLRDLHAVVIAGFTSVYCIMMRPELYNARRANEIGACSTVLYVIAEQWKSAKRYRDAFEAVAERLTEFLTMDQADQEPAPGVRNPTQQLGSLAQSREFATPVSATFAAELEPATRRDTDSYGRDDGNTVESLFTDLFTDSSANVGMDYGDEHLRDLLANEGLDWFLNGG